MPRIRISTTVDQDRLQRVRELFDLPDSQLVDRALESLLSEVAAQQERRALLAMPYEDDEAVSWVAPSTEPLPYDGDVPAEVLRLARERRATNEAD